MLKKIDKTDFDKVYEIMETSFPTDERRRYGEQKALLDNNRYGIYVLNDDIKAFAAVWEFEKVVFIEHLAVNPMFRNSGIGSDFLQQLGAHFSKMIFLEVELPENEIAKRRIKFYERNGFFLNEYDYVQPSMSEGKNAIPLMIMTSGAKIDECEFEEIKNMLYTHVYGK